MVRRSSFLVTAAMMTALMGHAGEMPDFSLLDLDDDGLIAKEFDEQLLAVVEGFGIGFKAAGGNFSQG